MQPEPVPRSRMRQRRVHEAVGLGVAEHGFDEKLRLRPWVERVRRNVEGKTPELAPAEDARHGLAGQMAGGKVRDPRGRIGGDCRIAVEDQAAGFAPACLRHQNPRIEPRAGKAGIFEEAAELADGAAKCQRRFGSRP